MLVVHILYNTAMPVNRSTKPLVVKGDKFGRWTALEDQPFTFTTQILCQCTCGTRRKTNVNNMRSGRSTSCGCYVRERLREAGRKRRKHHVNVGETYGRLTVVDVTSASAVECLCTCGTTTTVDSRVLYAGTTRSCGCLKRELIVALGKKHQQQQGASLHPLYTTWRRLAHGHAPVHPVWRESPTQFIADVEAELGPRPKDMWFRRKNEQLGYVPGNVAWMPRGGSNPRSNMLTNEQRQEIVELVRAGCKQYEVAQEYGVSSSLVSAICRDPRYS